MNDSLLVPNGLGSYSKRLKKKLRQHQVDYIASNDLEESPKKESNISFPFTKQAVNLLLNF